MYFKPQPHGFGNYKKDLLCIFRGGWLTISGAIKALIFLLGEKVMKHESYLQLLEELSSRGLSRLEVL